ncbi:MAG: 16S rRNA (guanine(527)-N(7))-methyltransferase RsmG [Dysosmobacter sp.]
MQCVHARAEEFAAEHRQSFDFAVSRAVANLSVLCELCLPLVKAGGYFLSMKSVESDEELESAKKAIKILGGQVERTADYQIPGTEVVHRVIFIKKLPKRQKISQTICKNQKESVIIRILAFESEVVP